MRSRKNGKGMTRAFTDKKAERGFTLLEIMIAICILSIGLLGIASMQLTAVEGNCSAKEMTESVCMAQDKLDELMALNYTHDWLDAGSHGSSPFQSDYTITWDITKNNPVNNAKLMMVSVTWVDDAGSSKTSQLSSLKYDW